MSDSIEAHLDRVDPVVNSLINVWLAARDHTNWDVAGRRVCIRWASVVQQPLAGVAIECEISGKTLLVAIDSLAGLDPRLVGEPFSSLPKSLRILVIERIAADFFTALPPALAHSADVKKVFWADYKLSAWPYAIGFVATREDGAETRGLLATDSVETLGWIEGNIPKLAPATTALSPDFPVSVRVRLGRTLLPISSVRKLAVGDVIWVDEGGTISRHGVSLVFIPGNSGRRTWSARVKHRTVRLDAPYAGQLVPEPIPISNRGGNNIMNTGRADIEVPVVFELTELILPLTQIENLQANQTFELEQDIALATVKLSVFGSQVAEGKLIAIGRKLGVRILRVSGTDKEKIAS